MVAAAQGTEWEAGGHADAAGWIELAGALALAALVVLYAWLVVRALLRRRRYRAVGVLSEADLAAVHATLVAAEERTVGEILPVVLERSDRHPGACWLAALVTALVFSAALLPWTAGHPALFLGTQLVLGALGYGLARALPDFQRAFVSEARAEEMAEEQAFQEFHRHDLTRTTARTGVLILVSLLERRVIVLADEGIDARVDAEQWKRTDEAVLAGIARGSLRDGLVAGIENAGAVLTAHFSADAGGRGEIPDRVVVRRE